VTVVEGLRFVPDVGLTSSGGSWLTSASMLARADEGRASIVVFLSPC